MQRERVLKVMPRIGMHYTGTYASNQQSQADGDELRPGFKRKRPVLITNHSRNSSVLASK